jgi:hypothetical protein
MRYWTWYEGHGSAGVTDRDPLKTIAYDDCGPPEIEESAAVSDPLAVICTLWASRIDLVD